MVANIDYEAVAHVVDEQLGNAVTAASRQVADTSKKALARVDETLAALSAGAKEGSLGAANRQVLKDAANAARQQRKVLADAAAVRKELMAGFAADLADLRAALGAPVSGAGDGA